MGKLRRIVDHPTTRVVLLIAAGAQAMVGAFVLGLAVNIGTSGVEGTPSAVVPVDRGPFPLVAAPVSGVFTTPASMVMTADGHLWFADFSTPSIGRIVARDTVMRYPTRVPEAPGILAAGSHGGVWYTEPAGAAIGFVTASGTMGRHPIGAVAVPRGVAVGPDGNVWFTADAGVGDWIGRMTPAGEVTRFLLPQSRRRPGPIVAGPDGNLWFAMADGLGRITTRGEITVVDVGPTSGTPTLTVGPDKTIWFAKNTPIGGASVGRVETGRVPKVTAVHGLPDGADLKGIVAGADGNLWVAELAREAIARVSPQGQVTQFTLLPGQYPEAMVAGDDGRLMFTFVAPRGTGGAGIFDLPR